MVKVIALTVLAIIIVAVCILIWAVTILERRDRVLKELPFEVKQLQATVNTTSEEDMERFVKLLESGNTEEAEKLANELFSIPAAKDGVKLVQMSEEEYKKLHRGGWKYALRFYVEHAVLFLGYHILYFIRPRKRRDDDD